MGLLLLSIVRDHVELMSEQPLRRPADWDALVRRIDGRVRLMLGPNEQTYTFLRDVRQQREWTPLDREAWPLPAVARLRVYIVPRYDARTEEERESRTSSGSYAANESTLPKRCISSARC
jgi:hypothetical protein